MPDAWCTKHGISEFDDVFFGGFLSHGDPQVTIGAIAFSSKMVK